MVEEADAHDPRDLMRTDKTKWQAVANAVNDAGFSRCIRDRKACKIKWNQLYPDYKKIADYFSQSGRNVADYWDLTGSQQKFQSLPQRFPQEFYVAIDEWCGQRAHINPPHVRDSLNPTDSNYVEPVDGRNEDGLKSRSVDDARAHAKPSKAPIPISTDSSSKFPSRRTPPTGPPPPTSTAMHGLVRPLPFAGVPTGVIPQTLTSSSTRTPSQKTVVGNTGVKRKTPTGPSILADATKLTRKIMASQMKEIADASLQLERSKVETQRQLFAEQMAYQRERDRQLQENAMRSYDNAKETVIKQQAMVNCLSELTKVLATSFYTIGTSSRAPAVMHGPVLAQGSDERLFTTSTLPHHSPFISAGRDNPEGASSARHLNTTTSGAEATP